MSLQVKAPDMPERKAAVFFDDLTVLMRKVLKEAGAKVVRL